MRASDSTLDLSAQKGEALLCRAYSHFILVNIFCQAYKDESASTGDIGIAYVTEPETIVQVNYPRETVTAVYAKIPERYRSWYWINLRSELSGAEVSF
ncbi:MAG: RagB/SusD family nutrient uptake outer membrane protein [Paludibacter sp.]